MKDIAIDLRYVRRQLDTSGSAPAATVVPRARALAWPAIAAIAAAIAIAVSLYQIDAGNELSPVATGPIAIERLTTTGDTIDATISPDGKYLAHVEAIGQAQTLWVLDLASAQDTKILELVEFSVRNPVFAGWGLDLSHRPR